MMFDEMEIAPPVEANHTLKFTTHHGPELQNKLEEMQGAFGQLHSKPRPSVRFPDYQDLRSQVSKQQWTSTALVSGR